MSQSRPPCLSRVVGVCKSCSVVVPAAPPCPASHLVGCAGLASTLSSFSCRSPVLPLPNMLEVSTQFNRSRDVQQNNSPNTTIEEKTFTPLRILMMQTFWRELLVRVQRVQSNLQGELGAGLLQKGLITAEGAWTFLQWDAATKSLKATIQKAIPMAEMIILLNEVLEMVQLPDMMHRLTALKPLKTADLSSPEARFILATRALQHTPPNVTVNSGQQRSSTSHDTGEAGNLETREASRATCKGCLWPQLRPALRRMQLINGCNCCYMNSVVCAHLWVLTSRQQCADPDGWVQQLLSALCKNTQQLSPVAV